MTVSQVFLKYILTLTSTRLGPEEMNKADLLPALTELTFRNRNHKSMRCQEDRKEK